MSGLRLSHFSAAWKQEFEQAKSMLLWATEGWITDVVHIGATSIEGGLAAPTIDMLAGISSLSGLNEAATLIEGLHYQRHPAPAWTDQELVALLVRVKEHQPTHTVLLAKADGRIYQQCLFIQRTLATNYLLREEFETLKKEQFLAGGCAQQYFQTKADFFQRLLASE